MNENIKGFMEFVSTNEDICNRIKDVNELYPDLDENMGKLIEIATEYGFDITMNDFYEKKQSLSDEELSNIVGGYEATRGVKISELLLNAIARYTTQQI